MNTQISTITKQTMTLKEITDLLDVEHNKAMKTVSLMSASHEFGLLEKTTTKQKTGFGERTIVTYQLDKRQSMAVASRLNTALLMKVIDRWQALEEKQVDPMKALNDPAVMRGLLLGYTERVLSLESEVVELKPKAEALERIAVSSDGSYCIRDAAKIMQLQEKVFIAWLLEHEWVYRRTGQSGLIAYAPILKKGYMEHKLTTGDKTDGSGEQWSKTQARITSKGLVRLSLALGIEMDEAA